MSAFDWERFLRQWSQAVLESMSEDQLLQFPSTVIESQWLGYPGATEAQIIQLERRLKLKLPPSYREFLKVTNGWRQTTPFIRRLWSTEEIERFVTRHAKWIDAFIEQHETAHLSFDTTAEFDELWEPPSVSDQEYFVYGKDQDCSKLRAEYLSTAIEISDVSESAVYLLNPQVVTKEGEWEAWFFSDWLPGADRYPSFWDMMQAEYQNFLELQTTALEEQVAKGQHQGLLTQFPSERCLLESFEATSLSNADPIQSTIESSTWVPAKRLTIEFQTQQVGAHTEYRTIASAGTGESLKIWSSWSELKLRQWLRQQLVEGGLLQSVDAVPIPSPEVRISETQPRSKPLLDTPKTTPETTPKTTPETTVTELVQAPAPPPQKLADLTLEIDQLEICQETQPRAHIVIRPAQMQPKRTGIASLLGQQPFSLEVAFKLVGQSHSHLTIQSTTYKAQFYAQNRTTGQWVTLGETQPDRVIIDQQTYIAHLFGNTLEPGIYRLQVLAILRGEIAALTSFELPFLQVM